MLEVGINKIKNIKKDFDQAIIIFVASRNRLAY